MGSTQGEAKLSTPAPKTAGREGSMGGENPRGRKTIQATRSMARRKSSRVWR